jgi:hypothetical protein
MDDCLRFARRISSIKANANPESTEISGNSFKSAISAQFWVVTPTLKAKESFSDPVPASPSSFA